MDLNGQLANRFYPLDNNLFNSAIKNLSGHALRTLLQTIGLIKMEHDSYTAIEIDRHCLLETLDTSSKVFRRIWSELGPLGVVRCDNISRQRLKLICELPRPLAYTRIYQSFLDQLNDPKLTQGSVKVLCVIYRDNKGVKNSSGIITFNDFSKMTGLGRAQVFRTLEGLKKDGVITQSFGKIVTGGIINSFRINNKQFKFKSAQNDTELPQKSAQNDTPSYPQYNIHKESLDAIRACKKVVPLPKHVFNDLLKKDPYLRKNAKTIANLLIKYARFSHLKDNSKERLNLAYKLIALAETMHNNGTMRYKRSPGLLLTTELPGQETALNRAIEYYAILKKKRQTDKKSLMGNSEKKLNNDIKVVLKPIEQVYKTSSLELEVKKPTKEISVKSKRIMQTLETGFQIPKDEFEKLRLIATKEFLEIGHTLNDIPKNQLKIRIKNLYVEAC